MSTERHRARGATTTKEYIVGLKNYKTSTSPFNSVEVSRQQHTQSINDSTNLERPVKASIFISTPITSPKVLK